MYNIAKTIYELLDKRQHSKKKQRCAIAFYTLAPFQATNRVPYV